MNAQCVPIADADELAGLDHHADSGAFLVFNHNFGEIGDGDDVDSVIMQISPCDCNSLDCLIDSSGSNGLDFRSIMFPHDAGNCARYRR